MISHCDPSAGHAGQALMCCQRHLGASPCLFLASALNTHPPLACLACQASARRTACTWLAPAANLVHVSRQAARWPAQLLVDGQIKQGLAGLSLSWGMPGPNGCCFDRAPACLSVMHRPVPAVRPSHLPVPLTFVRPLLCSPATPALRSFRRQRSPARMREDRQRSRGCTPAGVLQGLLRRAQC